MPTRGIALKLSEDDRLHYVSKELQSWIETTCADTQEINNWCRRWGTNKKNLERFIGGSSAALSVPTLNSISRDTGISLEALVYHAEVAGVYKKETSLTPRVYGSSADAPLVRLLMFPDAQTWYQHQLDFAGSEIWVRAIEGAELPPAASLEVWIGTGLRLLDQEDFVWDFRTVDPSQRWGRWRPGPQGGRVALLNLTLHSQRVIMGERLGVLRLAPKVPLRCAIYTVPEGFQKPAQEV